MNDTLKYFADRYKFDPAARGPITLIQQSRVEMAECFKALGFQVGAEVGVAQGHHSLILCQTIPGLTLHAIDPWTPYFGYHEYDDRITRYYLEARERLDGYHVLYHPTFSMDAVRDFQDGSLDFVYLDGAHDFKNICDDLCEWTQKVRIGGVVYGHDYKHKHGEYTVEVRHAVQAYTYVKNIKPWFVLDIPSRQGGESWAFIRQEGQYT